MHTYEKFFIGGEWVDPAGSDTLKVMSPTSGDIVGSVPVATPADMDRAVAFYDALLPLMKYLCRISYRQMMDPSDLAMAYCKRGSVQEKRQEFFWYRYEKFGKDPIWMDPAFPWRAKDVVLMGDPRIEKTFNDDEIVALFRKDIRRFSEQGRGRARN